jgi:hypothetical protein
MTTGDWFKQYGSDKKETFYRIEKIIPEELVVLEQVYYDTLFRKIIASKSIEIPLKEWLEMIANNTVFPLPQSEIPFLITI